MRRWRGTIALVIRPICWPLRELATSGRETSTRGIPQRAAAPVFKKLSSAPESSRADVFLVPPVQFRVTGRQRLWVEDSIGITPTSAPRSTSGRDPFTGQFEAKWPAPPQYRHARCQTRLSRSSFMSLDRSTIMASVSAPGSLLVGDGVGGEKRGRRGRRSAAVLEVPGRWTLSGIAFYDPQVENRSG